MIGVVADDLTGAAEVGAVGLRHGLRAEVLVQGKPGSEAELVCSDTDSRSCASDEAGRRTAAAVKRLREAGADWIYKKVDSVLRGNVATELAAAMGKLGANLALLLPANPALGRVIRKGRYFVHDKPLDQTDFARDPEHPRTSSNVLDLLKLARGLSIHIRSLEEPLPDTGIVVGEADTTADLERWAARRKPGMLFAGGAEFFEVLLVASGAARSSARADGAKAVGAGRELLVCGSTSDSCIKFVKHARELGLPVFLLPKALASGGEVRSTDLELIAETAIIALAEKRRVILSVGLPLVRDHATAKRMAIHLVELATRVVQQGRVEHVYAEGGATAVELVRRMGWSRLTVLREMRRGVVTLAVEGGQRLLLTVKPGTYLWPREILEPLPT